MSDDTIRIAKAGLLASVLGDDEGLLEIAHPQCTWTFPGDPRLLPWAGTFAGDEIAALMERVKGSLELLDHTPHTFLPVDERHVVVLSRDRARVKATGAVFDHQLCAIATLRDGRLFRWQEYGDTAAMEAGFTGDARPRPPCPEPQIASLPPARAWDRGVDGPVSPAALMKQLFISFHLGDNEGVLELVHPDGRFFYPGDPKVLPWAGWCDGREMGAFMEACKDALFYHDYCPLAFYPLDGTHVLVQAWERCEVKATGRFFENPHVGIATVVDGLCTRWEEFSDTSAMERAFLTRDRSEP